MQHTACCQAEYTSTASQFPRVLSVQERALADRTGVHRLPADSSAKAASDALTTVAIDAQSATGAQRIRNPYSTLPRTVEHDAQYVRSSE